MKILAIGDIVGDIGVKKVKSILEDLKKQENIDFVITNGENAAGPGSYKTESPLLQWNQKSH